MALTVITCLVVVLVVWWLLEYRRHERYLRRLRIRVHVNGSRGKSSVTRLIGAALRAGGIRTVTKTTGTNARFIFPDGSEEPIVRIGPANIKEQRWVVRRAAKLGAEALVTECMAIDPELQWVLQEKYIRGTVGVITNVRADHLDAMGPTVDDAAAALSAVMPQKRHGVDDPICFTAERERFDLLQRFAQKAGCRLVLVDPESVSDEDMSGFEYIEHKENVALALAVAQHFGIDRKVALEGMWRTNPDPGVLRLYEFEHDGRRVRFANAFAANDPDSTWRIWQLLSERLDEGEAVVVVCNSRADRIQRAAQLGKLMAKIPAQRYILVGALLAPIADDMRDGGVSEERIVFVPEGKPQDVFDRVVELGNDKLFVLGIGNIGGAGRAIAAFFAEKAQSKGGGNAQG